MPIPSGLSPGATAQALAASNVPSGGFLSDLMGGPDISNILTQAQAVSQPYADFGGFLRNLIPSAEAAQTRLPGMRPIQPAPSWEDTSALREALKGVALERDSTEKIDALSLDLGKAIVADPEKLEDYIKYIDPQIDEQTGLPSQKMSAAEYRDKIEHDLTRGGVTTQHSDTLAAMRGAQGTLPKLGGLVPSGFYTQGWQALENLFGTEGAAEQAKDIANIEQGAGFRGRKISPWDMLYGRKIFEGEYGSPYNEERFKGTELLPYPVLERDKSLSDPEPHVPVMRGAYVAPKVDFAQLVSHTGSGVGGDEIPQVRDVMPMISGEQVLRDQGITPTMPVINPFADEAPDDLMVEDLMYNPPFVAAQELIPDITPERFDDFVTSAILGIDTDQPVPQNLQALSELVQTDPTIDERYTPSSQALQDIMTQEESFSAIQEADQQRMERESRAAEASARQDRERQEKAAADARKAEESARRAQQEHKARANRIREEASARDRQIQEDDKKAIARANADAERARNKEREEAAKRRQAVEAARLNKLAEAARKQQEAEKKRMDDLLKKQMDDMMRNMRRAEQARVKYRGSTLGMRAGLGGPR